MKRAIEGLIEYPNNPRRGNIPAIAESLRVNGQYKPIVVQKSTNFVLVGNHTLKAAISLGWKQIDVVFADIDDEHAKRIVLADNKTADGSTYDDAALLELLNSLPDIEGTGYDSGDVDALLASLQEPEPDPDRAGLGTPIVHYDIVFDDEEQQAAFHKLVRALKVRYPDAETIGERIQRFVSDEGEPALQGYGGRGGVI